MTCDCECCRAGKPQVGRLHQFCRHESGLPREKEDAYISLFLSQEQPFRLGDLTAWIIRRATFGLIVPRSGCGCDRRKKKLNAFGERVRNLIWRVHRVCASLFSVRKTR